MKETYRKLIIEEEATNFEIQVEEVSIEIEQKEKIRKRDFNWVIVMLITIFAIIVASHIFHLIIGK